MISKLSIRDQLDLHEMFISDPETGWQQCEEYGFTGYCRTFGWSHGFDLVGAEGEDYIVLDFEPLGPGIEEGWWTVAFKEVD